jgi:hypothetical protein
MNHTAEYIALTSTRDAALVQLGLMALAAVLTWYAIRLIPWPRVQQLLRFTYLAGGVAVYLATFLIEANALHG